MNRALQHGGVDDVRLQASLEHQPCRVLHLLLADFESSFLSPLSDLPIETRPPIPAEGVQRLQPTIGAAFATLPPLTLTCAYQAYLGFYNSYLKRLR